LNNGAGKLWQGLSGKWKAKTTIAKFNHRLPFGVLYCVETE